MSMSDPIADMITRVRNGVRGRLPRVDIPNSKLKVEIARILKNEGYISNFKVDAGNHQGRLRVFLKYGRGTGSKSGKPETSSGNRADARSDGNGSSFVPQTSVCVATWQSGTSSPLVSPTVWPS